MALSPQKFREIIFQLLYSQDIGHPNDESMTDLMMAELAVTKKNVKLAQDKVHAIVQKLPEIDPLISSVSTSYTFDRIQTVTKNILRLAVYELIFEKQIPHKVVISEAIRLSRKFSSPESASFSNAILDTLYQMSQGQKIDAHAIEKQSLQFLTQEQAAAEAALDYLSQKEETHDNS